MILPPGIEMDKVAKAIPRWVWDKGITLHSYSPLMDAGIAIPFFRVWLDLEGIPLELWKEGDVVRAVSRFGMYLGSLEPVMGGNYTTWSVFMAVEELERIPHAIEMKIVGMTFLVAVQPKR
jgi:hypothetical protein